MSLYAAEDSILNTVNSVKLDTKQGLQKQTRRVVMPGFSAAEGIVSSGYSAVEDKSLLLLVVLFEEDGGVVNWANVMHHLAPTTHTRKEYQDRLQYLLSTDKSMLNSIPANYFRGSSLQFDTVQSVTTIRTLTHTSTRTQQEIYEEIESIFGHFTQADVRQPSGQQHLNAGEIAPVGVSAILKQIDLTWTDTFLDVGSGLGTVLAQVVLQTPVREAIGLEIRDDLAQMSRSSISAWCSTFPRLHMVKVITGDVTTFTMDVTVLFSNNILFQPNSNLELHKYICGASSLRTVLLSQRFCARCTPNCPDEFCNLWKEARIIDTKTCWKEEPIQIYMYKRKRLQNLESLLDFVNEL